MSEAKFTKGPYFAQRVKAVSGMFTVTLGENGFNEDGDYLQVSLTESDSNAEQVASLFAAAPEMYGLLSNIKQCIENGHQLEEMVVRIQDFCDEIDETLAKARGEHV